MTTPLDKPPLAPSAASVSQDVSAPHLTEREAREREELLRFTFDSAPVGIYMADLEERYLKVNIAYERMVGYSEEELRDKSIFSLTHPDDLPGNQALRGELITGRREFFEIEKRYYAKSGGLIWVRNKVSLIKSSLGGPPITITVSQDITERKLAEQARQDSERRLRQALEDRERLCRDLHDNIIQAIYAVGMRLETCQRLLHHNPKDVAPQLAQTIGDLNGVIRDVRGYIAGSGPQVLSGPQLRAELAGLVKAIGATDTLRFRMNVDPLAVASFTPRQAEHVLHIAREALSNALRHSRARQGRLSLQGTNVGFRLQISDDGVGFDPGAARRNSGGLHNMESRAQQLGGRLEFLSSPGQGATVALYIPQEGKVHETG